MSHDIDLDIASDITDADLTRIGLSLGARKRLLNAFSQLSVSPSYQAEGQPPLQGHIAPFVMSGQRRHLTVLFCDVVGSTTLAEKMDPEDLRNVLLTFQRVCSEEVQRYQGKIGLFVGDGVTAYFGFPIAGETSAEQAVDSGLAMLAAIDRLGIMELKARCGIHSGEVVVGEMGAGEKRLPDGIVGEAPNVAARLQGMAQAGELVMSESTLQLVRGQFEVQELGFRDLKGVSKPVGVYRVVSRSAARGRFEALHHQKVLTPLIGRETELGFIFKRWESVLEGEGCAVLLQGEPGIGKSRLVQELRVGLRPGSELILHCSSQRQTTSLWPLTKLLYRLMDCAEIEEQDAKLYKLQQFVDGLVGSNGQLCRDLATLLENIPSGAVNLDPQRVRRASFDALLRIIDLTQAKAPVLIVFEDAHWMDPSTSEFVAQLLQSIADLRVFVLISSRPEFRADWMSSMQMATLPLARLNRRQTETMIREIAPVDLQDQLIAQLTDKTDGVPLFVEELTKSVLENAGGSSPDFRMVNIPATLQAALHARLDRLAPVREIIQASALLGRIFDADILADVIQRDETTVNVALRSLVDAELIFPRRGDRRESYEFKHALIQDAAAGTLLRDQRAFLHAKIADALERLRPETIDRIPELLGHHLQESGNWRRALDCWESAGSRALAQAATREAVTHFSNAVACAEKIGGLVGEPVRMAQIRLAFATALMQSEGYRSDRLFRAIELANAEATKSGVLNLQLEALGFFGVICNATGRNAQLLSLAAQKIAMNSMMSPVHSCALYARMGNSYFNAGQQRLASESLLKAEALFPQIDDVTTLSFIGGADQRVATTLYLVRSLIIMGRFDDAVEASERFLSKTEMTRPFDIAWVLMIKCYIDVLLGKPIELMTHASELIDLSERHGFAARKANGLTWRGYARSQLGDVDEAIQDAQDGMTGWLGQGVVFHTPERICALCEILLMSERFDEIDHLMDVADRLVQDTDEACFLAECLRYRALVLSSRGGHAGAVELLQKAIKVAQMQGADLFELRIATDWARLARNVGRHREAQIALEAVAQRLSSKLHIPELAAAGKLLGE